MHADVPSLARLSHSHKVGMLLIASIRKRSTRSTGRRGRQSRGDASSGLIVLREGPPCAHASKRHTTTARTSQFLAWIGGWMDVVSFIHYSAYLIQAAKRRKKKQANSSLLAACRSIVDIAPCMAAFLISGSTRLSLLGLVGRDGGLVLVRGVAAARGVHALDGCCRVSKSTRFQKGEAARRTLALLDLGHGRNVVLGVLESGLEARQWGSVARAAELRTSPALPWTMLPSSKGPFWLDPSPWRGMFVMCGGGSGGWWVGV
jgi:hypothetical protein